MPEKDHCDGLGYLNRYRKIPLQPKRYFFHEGNMKYFTSRLVYLQLIILIIGIVTFGCKKEKKTVFSTQEQQAFTTLKVNLERSIADLELTGSKIARFFLPPGISEEKMRSYLIAGVEGRDYIVACGLISPDGIMLYVEPEEYQKPEGLNLSNSDKYLYVKEKSETYITPILISPAGVLLQEYLLPVYNAGNQFLGVMTILVDTAKLLDFRHLIPDLNTINLLVFDTDGELIFNNRTRKLGGGNLKGLNAEGAEELIALIKRAEAEESGTSYYHIFDDQYDMEFMYYAQWISAKLPGRSWRIFMNTEYEIEE